MSFRFLHGDSYRDCCEPREPAGNGLRSSGGIHPILFRRTVTLHSVVGSHCCMGREMQRSRGKMCAIPSRIRGRRAGPGDVGKSRCFAKVKQISATRGSHSAWSGCRHQSHPFARHADSHGHIKERCASPPTSRPCRNTCKVGHSSGRTQELTITRERVQSGYGSGNNGNEVHRGLRRRIRRWRRRTPPTGRPRPDAAHSAHPITNTPELSLRRTGRRYDKF